VRNPIRVLPVNERHVRGRAKKHRKALHVFILFHSKNSYFRYERGRAPVAANARTIPVRGAAADLPSFT
jgi:hypothetical protein